MKFEYKLLKLLNKGLEQGKEFSFKEFRITLEDDLEDGDYYIIKNNNKFYLMDAVNYGESMMEHED